MSARGFLSVEGKERKLALLTADHEVTAGTVLKKIKIVVRVPLCFPDFR